MSGCQVKDRSGTWIDVPLKQDEVAVFLGKTAEVASSGLLKASTYRLVRPPPSVLYVKEFLDVLVNFEQVEKKVRVTLTCADLHCHCAGKPVREAHDHVV